MESGLTKLNSTEAFVVNTLSLRFYYIGVAGRTRFFPARRSQVQSPPSFPKKHKRSNFRVQEHVNLPKHEENNDGGNDTAKELQYRETRPEKRDTGNLIGVADIIGDICQVQCRRVWWNRGLQGKINPPKRLLSTSVVFVPTTTPSGR